MAKKINDYMAGWEDGLMMALDIVKKDGVEALEKEIQFRNVTGIRMPLAKKDLDKATVKIKEQLLDTVTVLSVATLHDEFGYGEKRLNKFIDEYQKQLEAYNSGYVERVRDFTTVMKEEGGIELN